MSIRKFQMAMEERGVEGSSYATVYRYLNGEGAPSVDFLRVAANVLGVREEWLILGKGERTTAREELAKQTQALKTRAVRGAIDAVASGSVEDEGQEHRFPRWPILGQLTPIAREVFFARLADMAEAGSDAGDLDADALRGFIERLGPDLQLILLIPLRCWGFTELSSLNRREFEAYAMAMLHALSLVISVPGGGASVSEYEGSLGPHLRRFWAEHVPEVRIVDRDEDGSSL